VRESWYDPLAMYKVITPERSIKMKLLVVILEIVLAILNYFD